MMAASPTIGILGTFADANLGDDAGPTALLHHFGRLVPGATFALFCRSPEIAQERFTFQAFPVQRRAPGQTRPWQPPPGLVESFSQEPASAPASGWRARARAIPPLRIAIHAVRTATSVFLQLPAELRFLWKSYRRLRSVDLLLVAGSNPIFDFVGGFWGYPYTMAKWAMLARIAGTRLAFVSVGAGPIVSRRSGRLLAWVLRRADYVSFRDEESRGLMRTHGFEGPALVCPDLAHGLPFFSAPRDSSAGKRVGINPMIVYHALFWPVGDRERYRRYIETLAALVAALGRDGFEVFLYGTQKDDAVPAREIQNVLRANFPAAAVPEYQSPETVAGLLQLSASADVLITTRFHGAVFGVITRRPTLAICYHEKTRAMLQAAGLGEFALDLEDMGQVPLRTAFDRLWERRGEIRATLDRHADRMRAQLAEQDARLVSLLARRGERPPVHPPLTAR